MWIKSAVLFKIIKTFLGPFSLLLEFQIKSFQLLEAVGFLGTKGLASGESLLVRFFLAGLFLEFGRLV